MFFTFSPRNGYFTDFCLRILWEVCLKYNYCYNLTCTEKKLTHTENLIVLTNDGVFCMLDGITDNKWSWSSLSWFVVAINQLAASRQSYNGGGGGFWVIVILWFWGWKLYILLCLGFLGCLFLFLFVFIRCLDFGRYALKILDIGENKRYLVI